jgi:TPR repeat protein
VPAATTPTAAYREAMAIMDRAYSGDLSGWDQAARRAMPLFQRAGEGGVGAAWIELGALYENGIGVITDNPRAIDYFLMAGESGLSEGYVRALMLLDQTGQATRFVDVFLVLARQDRGAALSAFDSVSANAPTWVQRYLADRGYYAGALDGRFGAGSQAALNAFLTGAPPPPVPAPAPAPDADLARALQAELSRVGCYEGPIDGKWGPGSARAMQNFNHWWGSAAPTGAPTSAGLNAVRAAPGLVCGVD